ncbi:MAG: low molecular weight phosphotyrosine protein phosphatase, partial [Clostridiales bacterium]|nr:low molecular weight phosphotyrosine protein phosphatase [Clostridiales bacterium]
MIKVMFVCWGNICRSPMAEAIFNDMTEKSGLSDRIR